MRGSYLTGIGRACGSGGGWEYREEDSWSWAGARVFVGLGVLTSWQYRDVSLMAEAVQCAALEDLMSRVPIAGTPGAARSLCLGGVQRASVRLAAPRANSVPFARRLGAGECECESALQMPF